MIMKLRAHSPMPEQLVPYTKYGNNIVHLVEVSYTYLANAHTSRLEEVFLVQSA
jgi:hypothetical protein